MHVTTGGVTYPHNAWIFLAETILTEIGRFCDENVGFFAGGIFSGTEFIFDDISLVL